MFNKDIKFKYPWRPYQQKVLNMLYYNKIKPV